MSVGIQWTNLGVLSQVLSICLLYFDLTSRQGLSLAGNLLNELGWPTSHREPPASVSLALRYVWL